MRERESSPPPPSASESTVNELGRRLDLKGNRMPARILRLLGHAQARVTDGPLGVAKGTAESAGREGVRSWTEPIRIGSSAPDVSSSTPLEEGVWAVSGLNRRN